jgi:hypothetical protein
VAIGADNFTFGGFREHNPCVSAHATTYVEKLLSSDVIEVHDPGRVLTAAISTGHRLQGSQLAPKFLIALGVRTLRFGEVVLSVVGIVLLHICTLALATIVLKTVPLRSV